jgi:putative endonuclease
MPGFRQVGSDAEKRAEEHLLREGYAIVTRNYKSGPSEIDIVAMDGAVVVFVEVRSRRLSAWTSPEESVDPKKQRRLWRTANEYLATTGMMESESRFDVIAIEGDDLRHHRDAFRDG